MSQSSSSSVTGFFTRDSNTFRMMDLFFGYHVHVNKPHKKSLTTPLHLACQNGSVEVIQRLLLNGGIESMSWKDKNGCLPFHLACQNGNVEIIKLLIANNNNNKSEISDSSKTSISVATTATLSKPPDKVDDSSTHSTTTTTTTTATQPQTTQNTANNSSKSSSSNNSPKPTTSSKLLSPTLMSNNPSQTQIYGSNIELRQVLLKAGVLKLKSNQNTPTTTTSSTASTTNTTNITTTTTTTNEPNIASHSKKRGIEELEDGNKTTQNTIITPPPLKLTETISHTNTNAPPLSIIVYNEKPTKRIRVIQDPASFLADLLG